MTKDIAIFAIKVAIVCILVGLTAYLVLDNIELASVANVINHNRAW